MIGLGLFILPKTYPGILIGRIPYINTNKQVDKKITDMWYQYHIRDDAPVAK